MTRLASPEAKVFEKYLASRKILIADPSAAARSGLFQTFHDLGAKTNQITLVNNYQNAVNEIPTVKPHIVVAEYELGKRCGLDLLQSQREQFPKETKDMLFVVVTSNTSQSAVARAAEEDVDAYILKPFTIEVIRKTLMKTAIAKIQPSAYLITIEAAKKLINEGKLDLAEAELAKAVGLDPSPALAYYYLGQVKYLRQVLDKAKGDYSKGLEINKIHYKCLVGLYELLVKQKSHGEAYEVVKRISQYFPANPKRLSEVLRLAIVNAKYEDVEKYYVIFCNMDTRDDNLIKYICAALVVCGRHYLNTKFKTRALELFHKAAATGTGRVKILKEIVQALLDHGMVKDADSFLAKFPAESMKSPEFLLLRFQVKDSDGTSSLVIEEGRSLIAQGFFDEKLYSIMIRRSIQAKLTGAAENLFNDAIKKYPEKKADFEKIVSETQRAAG